MKVQNLIIYESRVIFDILNEIKEELNCNLLFRSKEELSNINELEINLGNFEKKYRRTAIKELNKLLGILN